LAIQGLRAAAGDTALKRVDEEGRKTTDEPVVVDGYKIRRKN
jgi:hypothetical protein